MSQFATAGGGPLSFLDSLGQTAQNLTGAYVRVRADLKAAKTSDQTPAPANTPLQAGPLGIPGIWLAGGALLLIGGLFLLRKR